MKQLFHVVILFLIIGFHFGNTRATGAANSTRSNEKMSEDYLQKYGYLQTKYRENITQRRVALSTFQKFYGLTESGILDETTVELMKRERCGEKDMTNTLIDIRKYKNSKHLIVYVGQWSSKLPVLRQRSILKDIIEKWTTYTGVKFIWNSTHEGDINFIFDKDIYYQGPIKEQFGNGLCRVFFSHGKYYIYVNEKVALSYLLYQYTINHMFTHLFGMHHANGNAITNPLIYPKQIQVRVSRALFSAPCQTTIGSVFSYSGDGHSYFFKEDKYWRVSNGYTIDKGYPKLISSKFFGVPNDFDEIFLWGGRWYTYIFKGKYYYRFNSSIDRVDKGYPALIRDGWKNVPDNIDAAFTDGNFDTYFFKADLTYKYDNVKKEVAHGYPQKISKVFPNVPNNLDSVFRYYYDGNIYFFRDYNFWRWNKQSKMADGPFTVNKGWFNLCWAD